MALSLSWRPGFILETGSLATDYHLPDRSKQIEVHPDAVAAAASTAAATAAADAREAAREAAQELVDVHDDFVNPLTLTVNALQTKIDELHALASQVDPVAADAIKNRPN